MTDIHTPLLGFLDLEARIAVYSPEISTTDSKLERTVLLCVFFSFAIAFITLRLIPGTASLWVGLPALAIEALAAGFWIVWKARQEWHTLRQSKRQFSIELEQDYGRYLSILEWLRGFSDTEIQRRLRFVRSRRESLHQRLGLLTGGIERVGVIPVLVALYLQFKDVQQLWPPGISFLAGLVALALLILYAVGWWAVSLKLRLDLYERLLAEALERAQ